MRCIDVDKVRPLDELFDDETGEFESGRDRECDKDLDTLVSELGDYEHEGPSQEADEYMDHTPIEDELVEKTVIVGRRGRASFKEVRESEDSSFTGAQLATARSIGRETRRKKTNAPRSRISGKKKE